MPLAILSDVHLGKYWKGRYRSDIPVVLESSLETLGHHDTLIIAGDLFNSNSPDPITNSAAIEFLKAACDRHIHIVLLNGNHDFRRNVKAFEPLHTIDLPNVKVIWEPQELVCSGMSVFLIPYSTSYDIPSVTQMLDNLKLRSIGVAHAMIDGASLGTAGSVSPSPESLPVQFLRHPNIVQWVVGHIHHPQELPIAGTRVIIPGSIVQSDISEADTPDRCMYVFSSPDAYHTVKLASGWRFKRINMDFVGDRQAALDTQKRLLTDVKTGTPSMDVEVMHLDIHMSVEDASVVKLNELNKLPYRIVDIPAPTIVRKTTTKAANIRIGMSTTDAITGYLNRFCSEDSRAAVLEKALKVVQSCE